MAPGKKARKAKKKTPQETPSCRGACYIDTLDDELLEQCFRHCSERCQRCFGILSQVSQRWRSTSFLRGSAKAFITSANGRCMEEGPAFSLYDFTVADEDPEAGTFGSDGTPLTAKYRPRWLETLVQCPWRLCEVREFHVENVSLLCDERDEICQQTVAAVLKLLCTEGIMPRLRAIKLNLWHESEYDGDQIISAAVLLKMATAHPMLRSLYLRDCFVGPRYYEDREYRKGIISPAHFGRLGALCPKLESLEIGGAQWLTGAHLEALLGQPRYPGDDSQDCDTMEELDLWEAKWTQVAIRGAGLESGQDVERAICAVTQHCPELHEFTLTYNEYILDKHIAMLLEHCDPEVVDLSVCHNLSPQTVKLLADNMIFQLAASYCQWMTDSGIEYMVDKIVEAGGFNIGTFPEFKLLNTAVTPEGLRPTFNKVVQHTELSHFFSGLRIYQAQYLIDPEATHSYCSVTHSPEAKAWRALATDFGRFISFRPSDHDIP